MCCFARLRWHSRSLLWYAIALIDVAIGEVGPCNERLPLWVATQIMASTDETFLPCGNTYRSSHWIGRSTSGLRPCWGCLLAELSTSSLWIVFELTNDARTRKIRAGCDLRHDVRDIYRMARNFRGLKFSRISLDKTFRDLIFEDRRATPYLLRLLLI